MIPSKIHYCWFGRRPLPRTVLEYMQSWRKFFPDCEIKEWNEENFDVNLFEYTKEAYFAKKYAFVSDVARLWALVHEGGVYLDTDVRVLRPLDDVLWNQKAFVGFEHDVFVGTGVIASEPGLPFFKEFLSEYKTIHFFKKLNYDEMTNVHRITSFFVNRGLIQNNLKQKVGNVLVCPQVFFCNKDWASGRYYNDQESFMIHDFQSSWCDNSKKFFNRVKRKFFKIFTIISYYWAEFRKKNVN